MKDSIKKQSLPDLAGINVRLYESLSFFIFRSVKINFLSSSLDNIIHIRTAHKNFSSDSSLAVAVMVKIQNPFPVTK